MSMGRDISELQPPAFRPPVHNVSTKSHGANDAGWGKFLPRPSELSGNPISRNIWEQAGGMNNQYL
jgi:hypothetical protein